ncbi:MAG: hypothetical protein IJR28_04505 [Ottowia sp.]|nr:hypothetical protein [Ottowia sp.]
MFRFSSTSRSAGRRCAGVWALAVVGCVLQVLLALAVALALQMFFESSERARLGAHERQVREVLASTDSAAALAALSERMQRRFGALPDVALRVQGAYGQILYEQGAPVPRQALSRAAAAAPAPLLHWRDGDGRLWRGKVVMMRMPLESAAPLVVALALDVQQQRLFGLRLQAALVLYVLLAAAVLLWLARRVAAVQPAREGQALAQRVEPRLE